MQLRALMVLAGLLDPRRWRLRLLQLGGILGALTWIWVRAVQRAPIDSAVRDTLRAQRRARIRQRNTQLEHRRLYP